MSKTRAQGCSGPGKDTRRCGLKVVAHDLCHSHYRQLQRGAELTPLRSKAADGEGSAIHIRVPQPLRERMLELARRLGMTESDVWRQAGTEKLSRQR